MANKSKTIHIPLSEQDALAGLLKVKPTVAMPRPGANPTGNKKIKPNGRKPKAR